MNEHGDILHEIRGDDVPELTRFSGTAPTVVPGVNEQALQARPPLIDVFGQFVMSPAYGATQFAIPAGSVTIASGESAWYTLARVIVGEDIPECALVGVEYATLPTDSTGNGYGSGLGLDGSTTAIAWGTAYGNTAAIVVGESLGLAAAGSWTSRRCNLIGIEASGAGLAVSGGESYIDHSRFPPGKMADVTPGRIIERVRWLPVAHRLTEGMLIDLAVVFRSTDVHGKTAGQALCGHAEVKLIYAPTRSQRDFAA